MGVTSVFREMFNNYAEKLKEFVDGVMVTNWVTVWLVLLTKTETALDVVETDLINRTIKMKMYNPDTKESCFASCF